MANRVIHVQRLAIVPEEALLFGNVPLAEFMTFEDARQEAFERNEEETIQFLTSVMDNDPGVMGLEAAIDLEKATHLTRTLLAEEGAT